MKEKNEKPGIRDSTIKHFYVRLEEVIGELGVTKKEFAAAGGVTPQALSGYLKGVRKPDVETIAKWIREYNLNANYLLVYRGTVFRSEADNRHPMDIDNPDESPKAESGLGPVTAAVDKLEQAQLSMDPDASEQEILEAVLRTMGNRLQKLSPQYGGYGVRENNGRTPQAHEEPANYPKGAAPDVDGDPPTGMEQYFLPGSTAASKDRKESKE